MACGGENDLHLRMLLPSSITLRFSQLAWGWQWLIPTHRRSRMVEAEIFSRANEGAASTGICCLCSSDLESYSVCSAPAEFRLSRKNDGFDIRCFSRPTQRVYSPPSLPSIPLQSTFLNRPALLRLLRPLPLRLPSFFTDTCWNEEEPFAPWTKSLLPCPPLWGQL